MRTGRVVTASVVLGLSVLVVDATAAMQQGAQSGPLVRKGIPPLPDKPVADYPKSESLENILKWLKAKQIEMAKARARPGDDVIAVHTVAQLLSEAEWLSLVDRSAADIASGDASRVSPALRMAVELEQTSFTVPSLGAALGAKVFPAAAARLPRMTPDESRQLPALLSRLSRFTDPSVAIPALVAASRSEDEGVRRQGVQGFMELVSGPENPVKLTEAQRIEIADALVARFEDPDQRRIRSTAISVLGMIKPPPSRYVPKLVELLPREETRYSALLSLSNYGPDAIEALPALVELLKNGDQRTRQQTAFAVRSFGPAAKDAVPALVGLLESGDRYAMTSAASALGAIGPAASDALPKLDALAAENTPIAQEFARAADRIRGKPDPVEGDATERSAPVEPKTPAPK